MSKLFLLILFLLISITISAQENYIALITEPQIGNQESAQNLIEVVNNINIKKNVSYVVVLGNITANGKFDELIWAQEILDGLTVPYKVVGGENDYFLSEGNGSEIQQIWGNDQIIYPADKFSLFFISTIQPEFPEKKYINIETISAVDEQISRLKSERVLTFSYYQTNLAENSYDFTSKFLDKKIFSFVTKENKSSGSKSVYEGLYLNRKDGWGYLLFYSKKDSLFIQQILSEDIKKKIKPEIIKGIFSKPALVEQKKDVENLNAKNIIWTESFDKTSRLGSVYAENKIIAVFKNGLLISLDDKGFEKWRYDLNKRIAALPKIENDLLVISTMDGDIYTINLNTGNPYQTIGIGERITSGLTIIDVDESGTKTKAIVVGSQYGNLYCYDLLTLDPIWTQQLSDGGENIAITSPINFSSNKIFLSDNKGTLYCFSAVNGMLIWKIAGSKGGWRASSRSVNWGKNNLVSEGNLLYLIDAAGRLFCIDALLGNPKWELKDIGSIGQIINGAKDEFVLPTKKNTIAFVSLKTGKITKEIEIPFVNNRESITDLLILGEKIIVGSSDGWVYGIRSKQKVEKLFRKGPAPIISLNRVNKNCLITDYDGNLTLLNVSGK